MPRAPAVLLLIALTAGTAPAQEAGTASDLDRVAAEQKLAQRVESFVEMGMEREMALFITLMEQSGVEPAEMLMMFMMAEHGGGEAGGMMMLMNAMKRASGSQPVVFERSTGGIVIVDDGVLYTIDPSPLRVTGRLDYAETSRANRDAVWSLIAPLVAEWGGREMPGGPEAGTCAGNLRQLGTAFGQYVDANGGAFPGENWVQEITPYLDTTEVLRCPARPDLAVGYAMNEKMLGVAFDQIGEPGERILLVDTTVNAESPAGGAQLLPEVGAHEDGVMALFADGRVEWLETPEAREVLGLPIGE